MIKAFVDDIREGLRRNTSLVEFVAILREYRDKGLTAQAAADALESLRAGADEATDDRILEILDITVGFCSPHMRVWSTT